MWLDIFFRRDIFKSREMHLHVSLTPPFPSKSTGDKSQRKFYQKNKIEEGCDIRFIWGSVWEWVLCTWTSHNSCHTNWFIGQIYREFQISSRPEEIL